MESIQYPEIYLAIILFFFTCYFTRHGLPLNWPVLGMLPSLFVHIHRVHDRCVDLLKPTNCTFLLRGPWMADMNYLITADPANVHHIMSANFENYPKGYKFHKIFDILGDGIFNSDGEVWKFHRSCLRMLITQRRFFQFLVRVTNKKVEKGLVPVLEHFSLHGLAVDMQDVFQRFTFDTTCMLVTGQDPCCLSIEFPQVPFSEALDDAEQVIAYRHVLPESVWKLQRLLGIGLEKKLSEAWETLDRYIDSIISMKRESLLKSVSNLEDSEEGVDLLTSFMGEASTFMEEEKLSEIVELNNSDKFFRDTFLNLMIAGRDTTGSALTWFLWLVIKNPKVEEKLMAELKTKTQSSEKFHIFKAEETNSLTYLHATFCETLRLYPPVPFQIKSPNHSDVLPSGHSVHPKMKILVSLYAMGRMKAIWGEDCLEFKPERWISSQGKIKHEPSYKFFAFNAGPRTCLGKNVAFTQMKVAGATLIRNYKFDLVKGHHVAPDLSIILHMKHGLKVNVSKRYSS